MKNSFVVWFLLLFLMLAPVEGVFAKKVNQKDAEKTSVELLSEKDNTKENIQEPAAVEDRLKEIKHVETKVILEEKEVLPNGQAVVEIKINKINKEQQVFENPCNSEVEAFFQDFQVLQNKHDLNALKRLYVDNFINTDGYNKRQLFDLMKRTYASYPDLQTKYEIKKITSSKQYAMAVVAQNVSATTKSESKITKDKGQYNATLASVFYLKKIGKEWKIYSEAVINEVSILAYGSAKGVNALIDAPQKVLSGAEYGASVSVDIPNGYSAIASINNTQVAENYDMNGESFRQMQVDGTPLERVLKANSSNNNEAVVVSVGLTKLTQDMFKKAKMDISGLMILMRRVDIIPVNSNNKIDSDAKDEAK